jgi:hypothetical protein
VRISVPLPFVALPPLADVKMEQKIAKAAKKRL